MRHRVTVVVCVCVCVWFNLSKQWWISQEDLQIASALQSLDLKHGVFRKTASSRRYRIWVAAILVHRFKMWGFRKTASSWRHRTWVAAILVHRLAILLAPAGTRAYIHSCDFALDHVVFLLRALPLCLAWLYIVHMCIFITGRWPPLRAVVHRKKGMILYNF